MNSTEYADQPAFTNWQELARYKAGLLLAALNSIGGLRQIGTYAPEFIEALEAPYRELLEDLYTQEFPIAKLLDESDLTLGYIGPAVDREAIRLSLLDTLFTNVKGAIAKVIKAVSGLSGTKRLPPEMNLALTGFAHGSLYLGFKAADPTEEHLFGLEDPTFKATREALKTLKLVITDLTSNRPDEALMKDIPDPFVRDAALRAAKELSPSPQSGIHEVRVSGPGNEASGLVLTVETRKRASRLIEKPLGEPRLIKLVGRIREIDLDQRRLTLRSLEQGPEGIEEALIIYDDQLDPIAKDLLDRIVEVAGSSEGDGPKTRVFAGNVDVLTR